MHPTQPPLRGAKGGGQPHDAEDTLRSVQRADLVDLLGEGPIGGLVNGLKSVYLDGVPVENGDGSRNFADFGWQMQLGGAAGTQLTEPMGDVQTEVGVGVTVTQSLPVVRTIADPNVDSLRVTLLVPQMVQVLGNGDRQGTGVEFAIDVQSNGGGYVERFRDTIRGKTTSPYSRAVRVDLKATGPAPWDVRVRRISPPGDSNLINDFSWASYTAISGVRMAYKHSAVVRLTFDARNFSAVPVRSYDVMGFADWDVPVNHDPIARTYTGNWNGLFKQAWTNNPAWVLYGLVKHRRFGLGNYTSILPDKWVLYRLAQWCDAPVSNGRGGTEPRYTINAYIQQQAEAVRLLHDICAVFRGVLAYEGSQLGVTWDAPAAPVASFVPANVRDALFTYGDGSVANKKSSCTCWYNDLAQQGKRMPATWDDGDLVARYGMRSMEIDPLGVTSPSQALRMAKWALYSVDAEDRTVTFVTGAQGAALRMGEVFQVSDPSETGERLGGRVSTGSTTSLVQLDGTVQLMPAEAYTLWVTVPDPDDDTRLKLESRAVTSAPGIVSALTVTPPLPAAPEQDTPWLLEGSDVAPTLWRCLGKEPLDGEDGGREYQITGVAHEPGKWARIEADQPLALRPTRRLSDAAPRPLDATVTETVYLEGALSRQRATVSWRAPAPGLRYEVAWRIGSRPWVTMAPTSGNTVDVDDPGTGLFEARVQSINALGNRSVAVPVSKTLAGGAPFTGDLDATKGADSTNLRVGLGLNMLPNSDFVQSAAGWGIAFVQNYAPPGLGTDLTLQRNLAGPSWVPAGGAQLGLRRFGNARTGVVDIGPSVGMAVQAARRYEFSAYLASHRADCGLVVAWFDLNDQYLTESFVSLPRRVGGPLLADWARGGAIATAPAGAAIARFRARAFATDPGEADSYLFATRCVFAEALPGQTELSPWAPSYFTDARQLGYTGDLDATRNRVWFQPNDPGTAAGNGDIWVQTDALGTTVVAVLWRQAGLWRQGPMGPQGSPGQDGTDGVDGAPGQDGAPGVAAVLSSEAVVFPADAAGAITSYAGNATTMRVLLGGADDSANWTFSKVDSFGLSSTRLGNQVTVDSVASGTDSGYVDITAARFGYPTLTRRFSVSKSKAGAQGPQGAPGQDGADGSNGAPGQRGSVEAFRNITGSAWSDAEADAAIAAAGYGTPVTLDRVTLVNTGAGYVETRYRAAGAWLPFAAIVNGNLVVTGTITTDKLVANAATAASAASSQWTGQSFSATSDWTLPQDNLVALNATGARVKLMGSADVLAVFQTEGVAGVQGTVTVYVGTVAPANVVARASFLQPTAAMSPNLGFSCLRITVPLIGQHTPAAGVRQYIAHVALAPLGDANEPVVCSGYVDAIVYGLAEENKV